MLDHHHQPAVAGIEAAILVERAKMLRDAVDSCPLYLDTLATKLHHIVRLLDAGNTPEAFRILVDAIDLLDLTLQLLTQTHESLRPTDADFGPQHDIWPGTTVFLDLQRRLLSILKAVLNAKSSNDGPMLRDLLEYELIDNLTEWKINVIPLLRARIPV